MWIYGTVEYITYRVFLLLLFQGPETQKGLLHNLNVKYAFRFRLSLVIADIVLIPGNAWCCNYKTLEICYNRHTGYGGYGTWTRGARVIVLSSGDLMENNVNYVRLENGTIVDYFPSEAAYQYLADNIV
jgi:hypothetical protein